MKRALLLLCGVMTSLAAVPASAQIVSTVSEAEVAALRPGQYRWFDQASVQPASYGVAGEGVSIVVSIPSQLAYVYRDGALIGVSTVSTGKPGKDTPMPFMQRLTWDGIALHAGQLPGYPASHGCIRLPKEFARQLYELTSMGGSVSIIDTEHDAVFAPAAPPPFLAADTSKLGGDAFNVVTVSADSWVAGPAPAPAPAVETAPAATPVSAPARLTPVSGRAIAAPSRPITAPRTYRGSEPKVEFAPARPITQPITGG
jgi:hypothetical protein